MNSNLQQKYDTIENAFKNQAVFYADEVQMLFPELKKSTLYWNISKLVEEGYLKRIRNGVYTLNEWRGKNKVILSESASKIEEILVETGFQFYISGTDILAKFMLHVPEQYPVIVFAEKMAKEEITHVLQQANILVVEPTDLKEMYEDIVFSGDDRTLAILYLTDNFDLEVDGMATVEKAFVDLFYAISRNGYPLSIAELVRMYQNMVRLGIIDKKKAIAAAAKRNIQYDIRFIVESKFITEDAFQFVEILKREG